MPVTIDQVQQAIDVIAGHIIDTPCLHSRTLSRIFGAQVFLKFENPVEVEFVLQTRSPDHVRQASRPVPPEKIPGDASSGLATSLLRTEERGGFGGSLGSRHSELT